ncbi:hypothetical protein [Jiangella mangrovi]|uniref:Uncharacterized protein n=1 Tax=Jiangella mangrovi TaxID=1524084 RepID=A0A7W9GLQ0_9ACTN|nr:hypothetical protein [Jiangella mangrovi]MBB5785992.1 hypothetical protein [Jiangella mangrovi]
MSAEAWSALGSVLAVLAAGVSIGVAIRANKRSNEANQHADQANKIAREALDMKKEAVREAARPEVRVLLASAGAAKPEIMFFVEHDGLEDLEDVKLTVVARPKVGFYPDGRIGNRPLADGNFIGTVRAGTPWRGILVWDDPDQSPVTVRADVRQGDDAWLVRSVLDLFDDRRFDR